MKLLFNLVNIPTTTAYEDPMERSLNLCAFARVELQNN